MKLNRLERYTPWKLLIIFLLVGVVGFSPNSKVPRYFIGQATVKDEAYRRNIVFVIRSKDLKEADVIYRAEVRRLFKRALPKTNTDSSNGGDTYSLWEINFDNVLHK